MNNDSKKNKKKIDISSKKSSKQDYLNENLNEGKRKNNANPNDKLNEIIEEDVIEEKQNKEKNKKDKNSKYKYLIYIFVILAITAFVLWYNLTRTTTGVDGDVEYVYQTIPEVAKQTNVWFFILFILSVVCGVLLASFIIWLFARLYTRHYKYHQAIANSMIGSFYSAITPGASGGQFAQVYVFKKQGMPVVNSASIFVMSFIVYQTCLIIFGLISLFSCFTTIMNINVIPITIADVSINIPIWIFIALGFVLNLVVIVALFFMSLSRKFQNFVCNGIIGLLAKFKLIKNPEEKRKSIRIQVENYAIEFRRLKSNLSFSLIIFLVYCVSLINTNLQPFFCGLALNGFSPETMSDAGEIFKKMFECVAYSNFHQMATGLLPLPGSAGVSEIVFGALFGVDSGYFSQEFYLKGGINIVLLLWRFMTFYIPFIINGIVAATYKSRGMPVKERIVPVGDRKTMLTIQLETYSERKVTSDIAYETRVMERKEFLKKMKLVKKDKKASDKNESEDYNDTNNSKKEDI